MIIRRIAPSDNEQVAVIVRDALEELNAMKPGIAYFDQTAVHLNEIFKIKRWGYFVVEINGEIAGGGGFYSTEGLPENICELVKFYISKKFRRRGWGQKLLYKCMNEAKKNGYHKMYLEAMPELVNAVTMYAKNGFNHIPQSLGNSGHKDCDVWMMRDL
ncbi:MAG: GNAT family N-acetyltransferase [Bacteroidota bacterium]|nr:GNAT family N-acetyltransferase [Bacteroidota bacterium]